jgi:hypothetical protein
MSYKSPLATYYPSFILVEQRNIGLHVVNGFSASLEPKLENQIIVVTQAIKRDAVQHSAPSERCKRCRDHTTTRISA